VNIPRMVEEEKSQADTSNYYERNTTLKSLNPTSQNISIDNEYMKQTFAKKRTSNNNLGSIKFMN
jgi:hypothetical protein